MIGAVHAYPLFAASVSARTIVVVMLAWRLQNNNVWAEIGLRRNPSPRSERTLRFFGGGENLVFDRSMRQMMFCFVVDMFLPLCPR